MKSQSIAQTEQSGESENGIVAGARQSIAQTARDATAKIKSAAGETATRARAEVGRVAQDKKDRTAERVGSYGSALHESAKSLEENDPNIAWLAHRAADRLQSVADYVRESDFGRLRSDAEDVARRHPAAFFGGLFVAGLVLGNVLKASRRKVDDDFTTEDESEAEPLLAASSENDATSPTTAAGEI